AGRPLRCDDALLRHLEVDGRIHRPRGALSIRHLAVNQTNSPWNRFSITGTIRIAGLVAILPVSWCAARHQTTGDATLLTFAGIVLVASFCWLLVSGFFGYGGARRTDWIALLPFVAGLVVREVFTMHSVQELEIQFAQGPVGRHSVVYPL